MKELGTNTEKGLQKPEIEIHESVRKEITHIGSVRKINGHTLFSYNKKTFEIKKAEYENVAIVQGNNLNNIRGRGKVMIDKDCFYEQALNIKNFIKRLVRYGLVHGGNIEKLIIHK